MLTGLPPLISSQTRLLILGSFPGVASLQAQQYYGHPQNQFWRVLSAILGDIYGYKPINTGVISYQIRSDLLLSEKLGVWDVYASCRREGSLDSNIRQAVLNDFSTLRTLCPNLQAIAHNGSESFKHAKHTNNLGFPVFRLPSTSPANASWSFERKVAAWHEVFEKCGLNG